MTQIPNVTFAHLNLKYFQILKYVFYPSFNYLFLLYKVTVLLNVSQMTVQSFEEKVLRGALHMISPDVMVSDGKGTVLISSEEGETAENMNKLLSVSFYHYSLWSVRHRSSGLFWSRISILLKVPVFVARISIKNMI